MLRLPFEKIIPKKPSLHTISCASLSNKKRDCERVSGKSGIVTSPESGNTEYMEMHVALNMLRQVSFHIAIGRRSCKLASSSAPRRWLVTPLDGVHSFDR